jgi:hypothetical protein
MRINSDEQILYSKPSLIRLHLIRMSDIYFIFISTAHYIFHLFVFEIFLSFKAPLKN